MNRSVRAWARLSARATVSRVVAEASGTEARCRASASGSASAAALAGKLVGDIEPVRHAVDPGRFGVRIAVRRRRPPQRLAERGLRADHAADGVAGHAAGQPQHADDPFRRRLELAALRRPGFVRRDQSLGDFLEIAVGVLEGLFELGDQRRRRLVGDEMARELLRRCAARSPDGARDRRARRGLARRRCRDSACRARSARRARASA